MPVMVFSWHIGFFEFVTHFVKMCYMNVQFSIDYSMNLGEEKWN